MLPYYYYHYLYVYGLNNTELEYIYKITYVVDSTSLTQSETYYLMSTNI